MPSQPFTINFNQHNNTLFNNNPLTEHTSMAISAKICAPSQMTHKSRFQKSAGNPRNFYLWGLHSADPRSTTCLGRTVFYIILVTQCNNDYMKSNHHVPECPLHFLSNQTGDFRENRDDSLTWIRDALRVSQQIRSFCNNPHNRKKKIW